MNINRITMFAYLLVFFGLNQIAAFGQSEQYFKNWQDPEVKERIKTGIEQNRMGWFTLEFTDEEGKPADVKNVEIKQIKHEFLFGANLFMLHGFESEKENKKYEEVFTSLFNYATLPFYWKTLEPEKGEMRFTSENKEIYRRPPTDPLIEWCKEHEIVMKGHPLVWDNPNHQVPDWLSFDRDSIEYYINQHIKLLASRYGEDIRIWDVVNEAAGRHIEVPMPFDYPYKSFKMAEKCFDPDVVFISNNQSSNWNRYRGEFSPEYMLTETLLLKGAKVDVIGFNTHFFSEKTWQDIINGEHMTPGFQFDYLDTYSRLGTELHITEITFPTLPNNETGEAHQAQIAKDFYRLWFSHPNVTAITWWNMLDNTAVLGEDKWNGGFLRRDFSAKKSYEVIDQLINEEWNTTKKIDIIRGETKFKGFFGKYIIRGICNNKKFEKEVYLGKKSRREIKIEL